MNRWGITLKVQHNCIHFSNTNLVKSTVRFLLSDIVLPMYYCWVACLIAEAGFSSVSSSAPSSPDVDDTWETLDKETKLGKDGLID